MNAFSGLIQTLFFTSFKRTAMVLGGLVVALSLPVTIILVNQQQDLRQRASGDSCTPFAPGIDKLPDGWAWNQNSKPCAVCEIEQYCYKDAIGLYRHGVPPTDEGVGGIQCGSQICTSGQYCQTIPPPDADTDPTYRCVTRPTPYPTYAPPPTSAPTPTVHTPTPTVPPGGNDPTPTNTPIPELTDAPTATPTPDDPPISTCDPYTEGASAGVIDGADLSLARDEVIGIASTNLASCMTDPDTDATTGTDILKIRNEILGISN